MQDNFESLDSTKYFIFAPNRIGIYNYTNKNILKTLNNIMLMF